MLRPRSFALGSNWEAWDNNFELHYGNVISVLLNVQYQYSGIGASSPTSPCSRTE